jgi:hypothetical protein
MCADVWRSVEMCVLRPNTAFKVAKFNSCMNPRTHVILGCMFIGVTSVCQ